MEQVLVMFLFAIFLFGVLELGTHALKFHRASSLSREAGLIAFQDCAFKQGPALESCLNGVRNHIIAMIPSFFRTFDGTVIISMYQIDGLGQLQLQGIVGETPEYQTRYNAATIDPKIINTGHEVVAIGEFYNDNTVITEFWAKIGFVPPNDIYASEIV